MALLVIGKHFLARNVLKSHLACSHALIQHAKFLTTSRLPWRLNVIKATDSSFLTGLRSKCIHMSAWRYQSTNSQPSNNNKGNRNSNQQNREEKEANEEDPEKKAQARQILRIAVLFLIGLDLFLLLMLGREKDVKEYIGWQEFVNEYLMKGQVKGITASRVLDTVAVHLYSDDVVDGNRKTRQSREYKLMDIKPDVLEEKIREVERQVGIGPNDSLQITWKDHTSQIWAMRITLALLVIVGVGLGLRSMTKFISTANPFESMFKAAYTRGDQALSSTPQIKFKDIAGLQEAKVEIKEYVDYLKNPSRFQALGAKIPRGALLLGPPGCGKTLLAKAVATESEVPFLVMAGSDFVEMIGGLGASRVRSLFKDARNLRPCIIYIDEVDAIGRSRTSPGSTTPGGADESEHTLNQLLVEMDGMSDNSGIILLASTNRAEVLDKALLRPGRFDRHITIDLPTLIERKELFSMYLKKINIDNPGEKTLDFLAQSTPGQTGADIANICNEAALYAAREGSDSVKEMHLSYALDRILVGQAKKSNSLSSNERQTVAYHECGHLLVGWLLEHTDALLKVSIIPRTSAALGFAQYLPSDRKLYSREELFERMCMLLGGRAAETIVFNRVTTGAEDDLDKVRHLAYSQVKTYGMGDSIGLLSFPSDADGEYRTKPYSKHLQQKIDMEAQQMIANAYKKAEYLLMENRDKLEKLCHLLLREEEINYDQVKEVIGPPPHGEKKRVDVLHI